jgi:RNA polymerase sigma factor (sigma-70 family)
MNAATLTMMSDDQLCQQSRAGDREAFGGIVERYQSLICSLAYSACGNLSRSEDLAQETFVTAWQRLGELREPAKLRAWLCGIVRNLAANASRREQRRGGPAESLDAVAERASLEADPAAHAVTQEEETLLWRSLAGLSDTYREPMVLFYRQGRTAGKGMLAKLGLGVLVGPVIGLVCAWFGTRAAASTARSQPERDTILRFARWIIVFCFALSIGLAGVLSQAGQLYTASAVGAVASAKEAGTLAAKDWVKTQWLADVVEVLVHQVHWWILGCIACALGLRVWRDRQQRRESQLGIKMNKNHDNGK